MFQTLLVLGIVLLAVAYIGARFLRTARAVRRRDEGCGTGCGCGESGDFDSGARVRLSAGRGKA